MISFTVIQEGLDEDTREINEPNPQVTMPYETLDQILAEEATNERYSAGNDDGKMIDSNFVFSNNFIVSLQQRISLKKKNSQSAVFEKFYTFNFKRSHLCIHSHVFTLTNFK